ncbi:MAG: hypothetical protein AAGD32_10175 [Planctomycetota bacterium]
MLLLLLVIGCSKQAPPLTAQQQAATRAATQTAAGQYIDNLEAVATPPVGWALDDVKTGDNYIHYVWLSPTGKTAYGIVRFTPPIYVWANEFGHNAAFNFGFKPAMKDDQGYVKVLDKSWDGEARMLVFEVEGGTYTTRNHFRVRGRRGWTVYAGTFTGETPIAEELALAIEARNATTVAE